MSIDQLSPTDVGEPCRVGRPRDSSRDAAILECALALVAEVGYDRLTIDAIAKRCRASKATIYRRWDNKATLIVDAVKSIKSERLPMPVTGRLRSDLMTYVSALAAATQLSEMRVVLGLFAASRGDAELAGLLRDTLMADKLGQTRDWTRQQIACGAIRPDVSHDLVIEVVPAMIFTRFCFTAEPVDAGFLRHLVDDILLPLLSPPSGSAHIPDAPLSSAKAQLEQDAR